VPSSSQKAKNSRRMSPPAIPRAVRSLNPQIVGFLAGTLYLSLLTK
jgi:hypothetical protein